MPRTTVNIDSPILQDLKRLQKKERKSLGRLISDLLAVALSIQNSKLAKPKSFNWISRPMRARLDITDKEAIRLALEKDE